LVADQAIQAVPGRLAHPAQKFVLGISGQARRPLVHMLFSFVNNTGSPITALNISFNGEQWRVVAVIQVDLRVQLLARYQQMCQRFQRPAPHQCHRYCSNHT